MPRTRARTPPLAGQLTEPCVCARTRAGVSLVALRPPHVATHSTHPTFRSPEACAPGVPARPASGRALKFPEAATLQAIAIQGLLGPPAAHRMLSSSGPASSPLHRFSSQLVPASSPCFVVRPRPSAAGESSPSGVQRIPPLCPPCFWPA